MLNPKFAHRDVMEKKYNLTLLPGAVNSSFLSITIIVYHFKLFPTVLYETFVFKYINFYMQPFRVVEQGNYHVILHSITW